MAEQITEIENMYRFVCCLYFNELGEKWTEFVRALVVCCNLAKKG
jgi:hypothetical protein